MSQAISHPAGQRTKPRQGVPTLGPATALGPRAQPGTLSPNQQGNPVPWPSVRHGTPGYGRLDEGRTHPRLCRGLCSLGSLSPSWASGMAQSVTLGPEASLIARKPLPGSAGTHPRLLATQQGRRQSPGKGFPPRVLPQPWPGAQGPSETPEPKPAGVSSLGPVYAKALQGMAGWRKGVPTSGPAGDSAAWVL
ncbi:hypothetical protein NDU88_002410 [Pleurodeles waltl]|uniref:Uncharacterized protein n=1 Tax=Pleurodeles waltl TaxID=8319 RepID=A0AAV7TL44_PLEWA|nr:hypothetical protein NDU88_002410 [Pleurodeles waltl]